MRAEKSSTAVKYGLFDCYFSPAMRERYATDSEVQDYFEYILLQMRKIVVGQEKSSHKTDAYGKALAVITEAEKFIDSMR